jgi:hypothetical protein
MGAREVLPAESDAIYLDTSVLPKLDIEHEDAASPARVAVFMTTIPKYLSWAAATPSATCAATARASSSGRGPGGLRGYPLDFADGDQAGLASRRSTVSALSTGTSRTGWQRASDRRPALYPCCWPSDTPS